MCNYMIHYTPLHGMSELMTKCCHPHHVSPPQCRHSKSKQQVFCRQRLAQVVNGSGTSSTPF